MTEARTTIRNYFNEVGPAEFAKEVVAHTLPAYVCQAMAFLGTLPANYFMDKS